MKKFEIIIASLPHRERLVAEIYYDNMNWVQISQEEGELVLHFYPHPLQKCWEFSYDKALEILEDAKKKLIGDSLDSL
jgi:hypothetical protein